MLNSLVVSTSNFYPRSNYRHVFLCRLNQEIYNKLFISLNIVVIIFLNTISHRFHNSATRAKTLLCLDFFNLCLDMCLFSDIKIKSCARKGLLHENEKLITLVFTLVLAAQRSVQNKLRNVGALMRIQLTKYFYLRLAWNVLSAAQRGLVREL